MWLKHFCCAADVYQPPASRVRQHQQQQQQQSPVSGNKTLLSTGKMANTQPIPISHAHNNAGGGGSGLFGYNMTGRVGTGHQENPYKSPHVNPGGSGSSSSSSPSGVGNSGAGTAGRTGAVSASPGFMGGKKGQKD